MIALEPHPEGTILRVRAYAGSRRNGICGEQNGVLRVSVTQAPEKGKANKALRELLARELSLRKPQIELVSGANCSQKRFLIRGVAPEELLGRIEPLLMGD
jgi:hypothetical protein